MAGVSLAVTTLQMSILLAFQLSSVAGGSPLYFTHNLGPNLTIAKNGSDLQLRCHAKGSEPITYRWLQNEQDLEISREEVHVNGGILEFKPFLFHWKDYKLNVGTYQCIASNKDGSAFSMLAEVQSRILQVSIPSLTKVAPGDMVRFHVTLREAVPPPVYTWDTQTIINGNGSKRVFIFPNGALHILNVTSTDVSAGPYTVRLSNGYERKRKMTLQLKKVPSQCHTDIEIVSQNQVELGGTATIEVVIHNAGCVNGQLSVQWEKDGVNIIESSKYTHIAYSLLVDNVEQADSGNYTVTVSGTGVNLQKTVSLMVVVKASITSRFVREYMIRKHNDISVTCTGSGSPLPEVEWYKNTVKLVEDRVHIQLESMLGKSTLTIQSFNESDEGVYQCLTRNKEGVDYGTTYLRAGEDGVVGELVVDGQPSEPINVTAIVSGDRIDIHWSSPFVLSSQIVSYTVYYRPVDRPEKRLVHSKTDVLHVSIPDTVLGIEYSIAVSANTSVGESARSAVQRVTIPVVHPTSNGSSVTSSFPTIASTIDRAGNLSSFPGSDVPGTFYPPSGITDDFMLVVYIVAPIAGFCVLGLCCFMCRLCCRKKEVVVEEQKDETKPGWLPQNDPPKETEVHTPVASVIPMPKPQDNLTQPHSPTARTHIVSEETDYGTSVDGDAKAAVMPAVPVATSSVSSTLGRQVPVVAQDSRQVSTWGRQVPVVAQNSPRQASTLGRQVPVVAHDSPRQASTLGRQVPVVSRDSPRQTTSLGRQVPVVASKPREGSSFTLSSKSPPVTPAPPPATANSQAIAYQAARSATSLPRRITPSQAPTDQAPKLVKKNSLNQHSRTSGNNKPLERIPLNAVSQQRSQPPKKTVSDQEKQRLDSMIDELVLSPVISQHNPPRWPDPISSPQLTETYSPGAVFYDMQHAAASGYANQRDTGYASPSPPPPPPPAERLPSPPPELLESSPEGINLLDDIMKQLELDADNLNKWMDMGSS